MSTGSEIIGGRLNQMRTEAGLTVGELARRAGLEASALEEFERGEGSLTLSGLARVANVLGVSPSSLAHSSAPRAQAQIGSEVMLRTSMVGAHLRDEDFDEVTAFVRRARNFSTVGTLLGRRALAEKFEPSPPPLKRAHEGGYAVARRARSLLPERTGPLLNLVRLVEDRFGILVSVHEFEDGAVLGASCRAGDARLIVLNTTIRSATTRRFVLAHELGHHLMDLDRTAARTDADGLSSSPFWFENTPEEKRANAFAAMFLAPTDAVGEYLGPADPAGYGLKAAHEIVERSRRHFLLGYNAMAWHLHNLGYLKTRETVEALLNGGASESLLVDEEIPELDGLARSVAEALSRDLISAGRGRELLGMTIDDFEESPLRAGH